MTLTREKQYAKADQVLQGVPEPTPVSQRIAFHRLKAAIASGLGHNSEAAAQMKIALSLAPDDINLLLATALAETEAGALNDALQHAREAGESPAASSLIGDIEEQRGDYGQAVRAYERAVKLAPGQEQFRVNLALEWMKHQTFGPAIDLLEESAHLFPRSAKIRTLLGIARFAQGEIRDAEDAFEEAIRLDPGSDSSYRCLAQLVLQSSAAPPEPVAKSLCSWSAIVCNALKLRADREAGNTAGVREAIAELGLAPADSVIAHCELARGYDWAGETQQARVEMEKCVHLDPLPQNHYRLGLLYEKLGLTELAHREMQLRNQILAAMSEQTALGVNALQAYESSPPK